MNSHGVCQFFGSFPGIFKDSQGSLDELLFFVLI